MIAFRLAPLKKAVVHVLFAIGIEGAHFFRNANAAIDEHVLARRHSAGISDGTGVRPEIVCARCAVRLEIEVTESMLLSRFVVALTMLQSLSSLGIAISVDDFGIRFSSPPYLRHPLSRLKIDKSFTLVMLSKPDARAIFSFVIELAHELGIGVVAEGVETAEHLDTLTYSAGSK